MEDDQLLAIGKVFVFEVEAFYKEEVMGCGTY